jgi:ABC-2 type transport system ATP-binding protein
MTDTLTSLPGAAELGNGDPTNPATMGGPIAIDLKPATEAVNPDAAVSMRHVTKLYGPVRALDGLDLDIPRNSIFGIIGPNGAGKTTMMSIAATLLLPTSGVVRVMGHDPLTDPRSVRQQMGYMPDVMGVNERLTVNEYMNFYAHVFGRPKAQRQQVTDALLELVNLSNKKELLVDSLSRGMKQRLSLARSLIHEPQLLILDEPASGLDPAARVELRILLLELHRLGKTIIISSHILSELEEMCTHIGIIANGKLAAADLTKDIAGPTRRSIQLRIVLADGRTTETVVDSVEAQQALLYDLIVNQQLPVVEFTPFGGGLEQRFVDVVQAAGLPSYAPGWMPPYPAGPYTAGPHAAAPYAAGPYPVPPTFVAGPPS